MATLGQSWCFVFEGVSGANRTAPTSNNTRFDQQFLTLQERFVQGVNFAAEETGPVCLNLQAPTSVPVWPVGAEYSVLILKPVAQLGPSVQVYLEANERRSRQGQSAELC